jgi:peptide chain release factor 3
MAGSTPATFCTACDSPELDRARATMYAELREEIELVQGASHAFDEAAYLPGELTPVFFGSALGNFGVQEMLDGFVEHAPPPRSHATATPRG